jgi:ribokinase
MQAPSNLPRPPHVVVVGQLARDVVLVIDQMPEPGTAAAVRMRRETLGGRGANQAVAFAQLGLPVGLVAVVGDDRVADAMLDRAHQDGIEITHVFRRPGVETALVVEAVDADGRWRYLEDLPPETQLTVPDVEAAADALRAAAAVVVQSSSSRPRSRWRRPRRPRGRRASSSLDGLPDAETPRGAPRTSSMSSAPATGVGAPRRRRAGDVDALRAAAAKLLDAGPRVVVLAAGTPGTSSPGATRTGGVAATSCLPLTGERTSTRRAAAMPWSPPSPPRSCARSPAHRGAARRPRRRSDGDARGRAAALTPTSSTSAVDALRPFAPPTDRDRRPGPG